MGSSYFNSHSRKPKVQEFRVFQVHQQKGRFEVINQRKGDLSVSLLQKVLSLVRFVYLHVLVDLSAKILGLGFIFCDWVYIDKIDVVQLIMG